MIICLAELLRLRTTLRLIARGHGLLKGCKRRRRQAIGSNAAAMNVALGGSLWITGLGVVGRSRIRDLSRWLVVRSNVFSRGIVGMNSRLFLRWGPCRETSWDWECRDGSLEAAGTGWIRIP